MRPGITALIALGLFTTLAQAVEPAVPAVPAVEAAWARATPPGTSVAAVYLTIVGGDVADRLVAASTDVAGMTQVHSVTDDGGVARMREVEGVVVPAGKTVVLAPQGMHLMLMNLTRPLVAGERFVVSLRFEHAGPRDVDVAVIAPGQTAPTAP